MKNNSRYDLSSRLIHFFREVNATDGSSPDFPEDWGFGNVTEDSVYSPLFLLRCAIRHGRLCATWSRRNNVRTIYGRYPAVCFTEMPTAAFLETSVARLKRKEKISTYALTFPKLGMFKLGARPVIYGLSGSSTNLPDGKDGKARIIPKGILPIREQYRYVTYVPTEGRRGIDWTHEREWRWCMNDDSIILVYEQEIEEDGIVETMSDIPGLELYNQGISGLGTIVKNKDEARMILHDVLVQVDRGRIAPDMFDYVLVTDEIPSTVELRDPDQEADAIAAASINVKSYLDICDKTIWQKVQAIVKQVIGEALSPEPGESGGCWIWFIDNVHQVTRSLMNDGHLVVNSQGKYLLQLPFPNNLNLQQKEKLAKSAALIVKSSFGVEASYFSTLGSGGVDDLPFYCDDYLNNRLIYNFWSDG